MTDLHVSSIPMLNVLQKACETLVIHNHVMMAIESNVDARALLHAEANMAGTLVDHLIHIIANNKSDV